MAAAEIWVDSTGFATDGVGAGILAGEDRGYEECS